MQCHLMEIIYSCGREANVKIVHESKNMPLARTELHFGDANVSDYVYMFKKNAVS